MACLADELKGKQQADDADDHADVEHVGAARAGPYEARQAAQAQQRAQYLRRLVHFIPSIWRLGPLQACMHASTQQTIKGRRAILVATQRALHSLAVRQYRA